MIHRPLRLAALLLLAAGSAHAADCPRTSIEPTSVPATGTVGVDYLQTFTATNTNASPFTWSITSGLPDGLSIKATTGQVTGRPSQVGSYLFTVTATDATGCSGGRTYPLAVAQGSQTVTFTSAVPSGVEVGGTYFPAALASSGLPVTLTIDAAAASVCSIAGGTVTFNAVGDCVVDANQAGDANWSAAPQVQQTVAVGKSNQTITFTSTAPTGTQVGGPAYTVAATATSNLPVVFTIDASAAGICAIAGSSVTFQAVGNCVINANQAGDATYNAAPQVQQTFGVGKTDQTISFTSTAPANAAVAGAAYSVAATATSNLAVTFSIDASAAGVCAIAGSSVTFQAAGTCVINANQAGDVTWSPAPQVQQSFIVGKGSQTITFVSPVPPAVVGGTAYVVAATASSLLPVTYTIDPASSAVCTIAGTSVSFIGAGTCTIDVNQAGDANWNAAPQAQQNVVVGKGAQTITYTSTAPAAAAVGGATYTVTATSSAGLPVAFAIDPAASGVCTIAGATVSFIAAGTCVIDANQAGDANWNAAPQVQQGFAVGKGAQTITYTSTAPAAAVVGGPTYSVTATSSAGLPVTFAIDPLSGATCTIAGSTVSFIGTGTCTINANQAGNANYNAAPQAQQSFAVGKGAQTITYTSTAPAAAVVGGATYAVSATSSVGLPVTFAIDPIASGVCTIAGSTVSFTGVGTCVINANQAGNVNYNAAPQAQQTFAVGKGAQTITYTSTAPAAAVVGGATYTVAATSSAGLPVTLAIDPIASGVCSIAGSTVSFVAAGTCVINANQAGNVNYNAAPQAQQTFAVGKGAQTITYTSTAPAAAVVGGPAYTVVATSSAGLPVTFAIDASASGVCTIAGPTVSFTGAGTCVINANQAGNANYNAAPQAQQTFAVGKGAQTITYTSTAPAAAGVGGATYTVTATSSAGLAVTFAIDPSASAVCTIAGPVVSFIGAGTCTINANQAGNANYNAAPQAQQNFVVGKGSQTVSFTTTAPAAKVGGTPYVALATATSGLATTLTIDPSSAGVCASGGGAINFTAVGTCTINANQAGNANWNPAPQVQQNITVGKGDQTITFTSAAPIGASVAGPNYTVTATSSSGLPVTFSIDASSGTNCALSGGSVVNHAHPGNCTINATQAGNANWNAAQSQQTYGIAPGIEMVQFTSAPPADPRYQGPSYTVSATSTSGRPVSFVIDPPLLACAMNGANTVDFTAGGHCEITAYVNADADWGAAQTVMSFEVGKAAQTITFTSTAPAPASVGGTYTPTAAATSNLLVEFSTEPDQGANVCSIAGGLITFDAIGTCTINADQPGDGTWEAAPRVQQSFAVVECVRLALGEVMKGDMSDSASFCLANNGSTAQEFTYLPINNNGSSAIALSLAVNGIQAVTGPPAPRPAASPLAPLPVVGSDPATMTAHADIAAFPPEHKITATELIDRSNNPATKAIPIGPLTVGQLIDLNANLSGCSGTPDVRKARVEYVTTPQSAGQQVLYVVQEVVETTAGAGDWHPPVAGGFTALDYKNIADSMAQSPPGATPVGSNGTATLLKTGALDVLSTNFGAPSDVDSNGGVILFFTPAVNALSPPASSAVTPGTFLQRDLFSSSPSGCTLSNQGEILYMLVPDPTGMINSNVRTWSFVYGAAGTTIVHYLSHLTNATRRVYVNSASSFEEQWLDEALSWIASELVFFNTSVGIAPRSNAQLSTLTTGPNASVRVAAFNTYENQLYGSLRGIFYQIGSTNGNRRFGPLRTTVQGTPGSHDVIQQNFSTTALFLRYVLDRKNTGDTAIINAIANSTLTGRANLQASLNIDLDGWVRDFLVAAYTDDAVGSVAPEYTLPSWNYRSVYGGLGGFPLATDPISANPTTFNTTLGPGGGTRYVRFGIAAGGTATVNLTQGGVTPDPSITMALVRTK